MAGAVRDAIRRGLRYVRARYRTAALTGYRYERGGDVPHVQVQLHVGGSDDAARRDILSSAQRTEFRSWAEGWER
jgi:hypothetical protein